MKNNKFLVYILFFGLLVISTVIAMEKVDNNGNSIVHKSQLKAAVEEDYKSNFLQYHKKAIENAEKLPVPQLTDANDVRFGIGNIIQLNLNLSNITRTADATLWSTAINNYKTVMNQCPIPPEDKWPFRGAAKQYNLHLFEFTLKDIEAQKKELFENLLKRDPQDHRKKNEKPKNTNSWNPRLEKLLNDRVTL